MKIFMKITKTFILIIFWIVCFFNAGSTCWGYSNEQLKPDLIIIHELIKKGRSLEALKELRMMADHYPDQLDVLFLWGITAVEESYHPNWTKEEREELLDEAISAFQIMLSKEPNLHRIHLELARVYFLKGKDALAKKHFKKVLKEETPVYVEKNIQHFLAQIKKRRPWQAMISFAIVYDSNIDKISDEDTIYIYGLPFTLDKNEDEDTSGTGLSLRASGEYQHKMTEHLRWRMGGNINNMNYQGSKFDTITILGYAGPGWSLNQTNELSVLAAFRHNQNSRTSHYQDVEVRIETSHLLGLVKMNTQALRYNRYFQDGKEQTGESYEARALLSLTPAFQAKAKIGQKYESPEFNDRSLSISSIEAGLTLALPQQINLDLSREEQRVRYKGNWFPYIEDGSSRRDRVSVFRLNIHRDNFELFGFRPFLSFEKEKRRSNAQLHSYKRTFIGLNFTLSY